MTIVSSKEFVTNEEKYFELAISENVVIKKGGNVFHLTYAPAEIQYPEQPVLEPDDDLRRAISAEELLNRIHKDIRNKFKNRL